jgi:LCP family protein required for cell wall assembly
MLPAPLSQSKRPTKPAWVWPVVISLLLLGIGAWAFKALVFDATGPKNILILGVDEDKTRTDVVILAHIDQGKGIVNLISIPRDTYVNIPCGSIKVCQPTDKINHAHAYGGPDLTVSTVQGLLGVDIDGYMKVDFAGFEQVVDTLGGVDMVIDKDMYYLDPTPPRLEINFKASNQPQHLNGKKALQYVRFRNDGLGDIGRTERTRKFLTALMQTLNGGGKITKLPALMTTMWPNVKTNIDLGTAVALARVAPRIKANQIHMSMIPGHEGTSPNGLWIWNADVAKTQALVDSLIKHPQPLP